MSKKLEDILNLPNVKELENGQKIIIGIRPEYLFPSNNGIPAKIAVVEPTGSETHLLLRANDQDLTNLISILVLNIFVVLFISKFIYLKYNNRNKKSINEFFFTYNSAGLITFLLCFLLSNVKLDLGFALGLFAIFAILRFRTETIKVKEMTYFFVVIGVSAINALSNNNASIMELVVANGSIIALLFILEYSINKSTSE